MSAPGECVLGKVEGGEERRGQGRYRNSCSGEGMI